MNTYMVHMLERAREVHKINEGETGRDSVVKCPFCIADEDEQWFRFRHAYRLHPIINELRRPKRMPAPHCENCPLQSLLGIDYTMFMNDCVEVGFDALAEWEGVHDD